MRRNKTIALLLLAALMLPLFFFGSSSAGTSSDPLATLSYVINTYLPSLDSGIYTKAAASLDTAKAAAVSKANTRVNEASAAVTRDGVAKGAKSGVMRGISLTKTTGAQSVYRTLTLALGDKLTGAAGAGIMLVKGSAKNSGAAGAVVININTGKEIAPGGALPANNRIMLSEKTGCSVTITSAEATVLVRGTFKITPLYPLYGAKYLDLANALKNMNMLAGSGAGFALSNSLTRAESAVMLARLLGKEKEAAACTSPIPFTDVPTWAKPFVAYAYANGLLYGKSATLFDASGQLTKEQYITMILRSLGYTDTGASPDFVWDKSPAKAVELGVFSQKEMAIVTPSPFRRDYMVYLSYYALEARLKNDASTLLDMLISSGVTDSATSYTIRSNINRVRP